MLIRELLEGGAMRRKLRCVLSCFVFFLIVASVVVPSVGVAEETATTTSASAGDTDISGVYGYTGVTGSGKKRGGTATIVDNGDSVSISTTIRNVPILGVVPVNVEGDKVQVTPGRVTVHVSASLPIAEGAGELTFTKTTKRWNVKGAGQGEALGAQGTVTVTGFSHSAAYKPTDPPPNASRLVTSLHSALRWASSSKPQSNPDVVKMLTTLFAVLFALAMMAVETAVFGSAVAGGAVGGSTAAAGGAWRRRSRRTFGTGIRDAC